jgi:hypothetical protein
MKVDFILIIKIKGLRKNISFICWILVTNCWLKSYYIRFLLATFLTELEGLLLAPPGPSWPLLAICQTLQAPVAPWPLVAPCSPLWPAPAGP